MNFQFKSYLLIITTLLIGFCGGFVASGYMTKQRVKKWRTFMEKPHDLEQSLVDELALSPAQATAIHPLLQAHFTEVQGLSQQFRTNMHQEMSELTEALRPHLNEEQLRKFRRRLRHRRHRGHPPHHGPHGPPPQH